MLDVDNFIDIPGYEGLYKICISKNKILSLKFGREKILKLNPHKRTKHLQFALSGKIKKYFYFHQVVMLIKEGPCPEGKIVCHHDDDPWNNFPDNLYYGTRKDNSQDCLRNGRHSSLGKFGKDSPKAKKIVQETLEGVLVKQFDSIVEAGAELETTPSNIIQCCRGYRKTAKGFRWRYL